MPVSGKKLKLVSENVFQETENKGRPLEWRRDFNLISLCLKDIELSTVCEVHERNYDYDEALTKSFWSRVSPGGGTKRAIHASIDSYKFRDRLFNLGSPDAMGVFTVERLPSEMRVEIWEEMPAKKVDPLGESTGLPKGVLPGTMFYSKADDDANFVSLSVTIPSAQMQAILSSLEKEPDQKVELSAYLFSFTYEVDDALREWYHPRDILIKEGRAAAPVSVIRLSPASSESLDGGEEGDVSNESAGRDESPRESYPQDVQPLQSGPSADIAILASAISRVSKALWVLIVVVVIAVLFRL